MSRKLLSGSSSLSDSATGHATINPALDPFDPVDGFSSGESISWGVVAHSPAFVNKKLPWDSNISLSFSSGRNSRVENRYGFDGGALPNAQGKTHDIGVSLSLFDNKLQIKATWYETEVQNANIASVSTGSSTLGGDTYYVYLLESWGTASALTNLAGANGDASGYEWYWNWALINANWEWDYADPKGELFLNDPLTQQMLDASWSWLNQLQPQSWYDAYGMDVNVAAATAGEYKKALLGGNWAPGNIGGIQAAGAGRINGVYPTGTVDNKSEGVEIEVIGQPIDGLSISLNVSKTNAYQTALGTGLVNFIENAYRKYQTPAGDLRLWWGGDRTVREYFDNVWAAYQFQLQTNGKLVAEMSPWRANLVTNYTFQDGRLKGINVGGGIRWQDKAVIGYPLNEAQDNLDVDNPYWSDARNWLDLWAGYERQLTKTLKWRIQANLRNVGKDVGLVPISVQPDGTPAQYRIEEGMTWSISNTFSF